MYKYYCQKMNMSDLNLISWNLLISLLFIFLHDLKTVLYFIELIFHVSQLEVLVLNRMKSFRIFK